ncbi:leucine-rich repeat protein [Bacteroides faecichinchillae]|uniref:leucine-rich repeat protein n=1 Tax=Bacteroides faecichinchillae TaxID=871325 RepID=UPI000469FD9B|nr:leucine-rich repeat protein [Bacteroides faecichinchillae]THG68174.1 hypothetical protein E5981_06040 [Bacteroides faecichinchillae]
MYTKIIYFLIIACWLLHTGCSDENQPDNPAPEILLREAQDITRTSARLTGTVNASSNSKTDRYRFRYGTSLQMEQMDEQSLKNSHVSTELQDLIPGTTYYYCLEAGNKKYLKQSPIYSFTTIPNEVPKVDKINFLGQGPISIILQCAITDNGGETIIENGFCYTKTNGEEYELSAPLSDSNQWQLRIGDLEKDTQYTVRAFAENKIGRAYSEPYHFQTGSAVILTSAGTLPKIIGEEEKNEYSTLNIVGPLNGTDIRFIREMSGKDITGNPTPGILQQLDLTDALIVSGGMSYDESRHTEDHTIGYGMFGELEVLKEIELPASTLIIEQNAFKNSTALTKLSIPSNTEILTPSTGCKNLSHISIASGNTHYTSMDGVVYNKSGEILVWFPEGIMGANIQFSPTLKSIGDYALQKCKIRSIVLPNSLSSIGKQAFCESEIESVILPDGLRSVSTGLFQNCKSLTSVTLGSKCESISAYCFDNCPLQHLYVKASTPPVCHSETFNGAESIFANCILHIPPESRTQYRNHNIWKQFFHIEGVAF